MKKIETTHGTLSVQDFENIFKKAVSVSYNSEFIEIPGVVIFSKLGKKGFINKILNPSVEFIPVEDNLFDSMLAAVKVHEAEIDCISFDSKSKPAKRTIISLTQLKEQFIFGRIVEDSITINDMVFTNNEAEYHGDGMFTSKKVYFVNFELMAKVKETCF